MPAPPRPRERLAGLDVLRGLAALAVLLFHFTTRFEVIFGHPVAPAFSVPWGQRGVEVFFVISGFAIELSLRSASTAREFLAARALRLYPTFWAAMAVTLAVVEAFGLPERAVSIPDALLNLTMIPASLGGQAVDAVYWTLERELRFYGLVALLLALGLGRYTVHALLSLVAVQSLDAASSAVPHLVADLTNAGWVHLFACGALLARERRHPSWRNVAAIALCVASARLLGSMQLAWAAAAVALVWLATRPLDAPALRPLAVLGAISYPLYLVHQYVGYVVMRALYSHGAGPSLAIAAAAAVGLGTASVLHVAVETPCLALLRRRRRAAAERAPPVVA
jgi:peptidoglycan/LPS O-acetylase OafA/YrhL